MKSLVLVFLSFVLCTNAVKINYENFKVYNIVPESELQVQYLTNLRKEAGYDFWTEIIAVGRKAKIMVYPEFEEKFLANCNNINLKAEISISNLQTVIDESMKPTTNGTFKNIGTFDWESYHSIVEIHAWLDELAELYPDVVTTVVAGNSYEGRQIKGVIIDFKPDDRGSNPLTGIIEGGIHAREWISPATVTWIIKEFLTSTDTDVRKLAETFVWHIFPVINPDGYAYTFSDNRLWRKNRNPNHFTTCGNNDDNSRGIDLNRNFDFAWMSTGASQNPCDQTFAGASGASEPETRAISNYVLALNQNSDLMYYLAFHSYGQMILVPYSHVSGTDKLQAVNYGDMYEVAIRGSEALTNVNGIPYEVGVSGEILYEVSGSSFDWVKGVANVPMTFLFELRDVGDFGFLLPTDQIIPNNEEIMACLVEMDKTTEHLRYYYSGSSAIFNSVALILTAIVVLVYTH